MDTYEVRLTLFAEEALRNIGFYIANALQASQASVHTLLLLQKEIGSLSQMPARFPLVPEEPWHSEEVRKMPVKNFIVYYWIDEKRKLVQVIHVLYARRDQMEQLAKVPQFQT